MKETVTKIMEEWTDKEGKRRRKLVERTHEVSEPQMPINQVILHPDDVRYSQGDDDGDFMGITDDKLLVELFTHRLDELKCHIEPVGVKRVGSDGQPLKTNTREGLEFLKHDHRGPVGRTTIWRSRALAVGDNEAARAISIGIQECIDEAKRLPEWSDIRLAVHLPNWEKDSQGEYHFTKRLPVEELEGGRFPMELIKNWIDERIMATGMVRTVLDNRTGEEKEVAGDPLWWRQPGKRVNTDEWFVPSENAATMKFENLVHVAARKTYELWNEFSGAFEQEATAHLEVLLPSVFKAFGIEATFMNLNSKDYLNLRNKVGLTKYNQQLKSLMSQKNSGSTEDSSYRHYTRGLWMIQNELESNIIAKLNDNSLTMSEILTIWVKEFLPGGNPNDAFRTICWPDSPILKALGIGQDLKCVFLQKQHNGVNRLEFILDKCLKNPEPFKTMYDLVKMSKHHSVEVIDENGVPVHFGQCADCMENLTTTVVRAVRERTAAVEKDWLIKLVKNLK